MSENMTKELNMNNVELNENVNGVEEEKQYIVVNIGDEYFGIDIMNIDNIVRMQRITRVPKAEAFFKGVINLRGEVLPVMSLRKKFGIDDDAITNASRIIIVKINGLVFSQRLIIRRRRRR